LDVISGKPQSAVISDQTPMAAEMMFTRLLRSASRAIGKPRLA